MFIKFNATDGVKKEYSSEICTFEGIRFDIDTEFAILSTEHTSHDYLMPMTKDVYEDFAFELYNAAAKSLMHPGSMVEITGTPLIRVKHGSLTQWDKTEEYVYKLKMSSGMPAPKNPAGGKYVL